MWFNKTIVVLFDGVVASTRLMVCDLVEMYRAFRFGVDATMCNCMRVLGV